MHLVLLGMQRDMMHGVSIVVQEIISRHERIAGDTRVQ